MTLPTPVANAAALTTTANSGAGTAVLPSSKIASYVNQQLPGLTSGTSGQVGGSPNVAAAAASQSQGSQVNTDGTPAAGSVADITNQTNQNIQDQNSRLSQYAAIKQAKTNAATAAASSGAGGGGSGGGGSTNGMSPTNFNVPGGLGSARSEVLSDARSYIGDRYVLGGSTHAGIDCSGLVMAVYDKYGFGKYLNSHLAGHQAKAIPGVRTAVRNLRPGDIVAWSDGSHIAIYAGNGMIIAAAAPGEGVKYQPVWGNCYGIHLTLPGD